MGRRVSGSKREPLVGVRTNVITGFLGAGKSTAIRHLLRQRPPHERWAILVNEFGEVGIDGSLIEGQAEADENAFVREVVGGCMCCTAGLPMQIVMTALLASARPDRLLIEPTGLGHPREVLEVLSSHHYRDVLDLRGTVTLVDARKIYDRRFTEHPIFRDQLCVADVIVANKKDQYDAEDLPALQEFLSEVMGLTDRPVHAVEGGALERAWLEGPAGGRVTPSTRPESRGDDPGTAEPEIPAEGFRRFDRSEEGFFCFGWIFDRAWVFDGSRLHEILRGIEAERLKGVFRTRDGVHTYNLADGVLERSVQPAMRDSRVEVISAEESAFAGLEEALLGCVTSRPESPCDD